MSPSANNVGKAKVKESRKTNWVTNAGSLRGGRSGRRKPWSNLSFLFTDKHHTLDHHIDKERSDLSLNNKCLDSFEPTVRNPSWGQSPTLEILSLHEKIDELREMKWGELITMQQEQLRLLTQLMKRHESADGKHRRLAVRNTCS